MCPDDDTLSVAVFTLHKHQQCLWPQWAATCFKFGEGRWRLALPGHGTVQRTGPRTLSYTPTLNYHGADAFTYQLSDGRALSKAATVSITVNPGVGGPGSPGMQPCSPSLRLPFQPGIVV